jgi:hypothetical protein
MGMAAFFVPIDRDKLEQLKTEPTQVEVFLFPEDDDSDVEPEGTADVDKAWHGLHFLLCALAGDEHSPLASAVLGGSELGEDLGYGPPRYLEPAQVKEISEALGSVSTAQLEDAFDPVAMSKADVYPDIWERDGTEALEYLLHFFPTLVSFYKDTARSGRGAILYLA